MTGVQTCALPIFGQLEVIFRKISFSVTAKHAEKGENDFLKSFSPKTNAPKVTIFSLSAQSPFSLLPSLTPSSPTQLIQLTPSSPPPLPQPPTESASFRFRPPSLLHNRPFASHLQPTTAVEDLAAMKDPTAAVAADRAADPASLVWVFRWVCTVFGFGFPVIFN